MKHIALIVFSLVCIGANAQTIYLKSGNLNPSQNVGSINDFTDWNSVQFEDKNYCLMQFSEAVSDGLRAQITAQTGIQFYDYFPKWTFLTAIPKQTNLTALAYFKVRSIIPHESGFKIQPGLIDRPLPLWIDRGNGKIALTIDLLPVISQSRAEALLNAEGATVVNWKKATQVNIIVHENAIQTLAAMPWIKYVQPVSAPPVTENARGRTNHRVNTIDASYVTGLHYDGTGVSVAEGDDGVVGPHIDFAGRLIHHTNNDNGTHGDHVGGIIAGGGNYDPVTSGNARGADLHVYSNYDNLDDAPLDYTTDGVRITSNSLGQSCNLGYNNDARDADELINSKFSLMSVHSAGNSGNTTCGGVPQGFYTITGGYKAGKNVLAVGNVTSADNLAASSSKGPSEDGRLKPEIVAVGTNVYSTQPDNAYDTFSGTSMACPGVAGTLADLWQAYRETHAGADPYSALIKALLMNTADDLGNPGPDFSFGYGRINAHKAYRAMASNQYFIDSLTNGQGKDYTINVPPNTRQMKVMLYWHDVEGNPASSVALVNNLNLSVQEPSGNVIDPWILNNSPSVAALTAPAVRGGDNINNVEQVTIDSVFAGPSIISVYAADIPVGTQKYILTYEFLNDDLTLTYPQGGESFAHGQQERVRWDAFGNNGDFTLEYSDDGGTAWNVVSSAIASNRRYFDWTPPTTLNTGRMKMRISRGASFDESDSLFTVFDVPKNLEVDTACGTVFHLKWDILPFATEYKIFSMGPKYMTEIATSTTNEITLTTGVNTTDTFYFAVSGVSSISSANGRRTIAVTKLPGEINCLDDAYNVETILPFDEAYNCSITGPLPIKVKLKNIGWRALTNLPIFYQVNANPVVSEIFAGPLAVGDSAIYTFTTLAAFPAPTTYTVRTWTSVFTDVNKMNDTSVATCAVIIPTLMTAPTIEDFEGPVFPPTGWRVIDNDISVKWQKTLVLVDPNGFNTHTAYMDFFNYTSFNQFDDLESAYYDLSGVTADTVLMTFDLSHAYGIKGIDSLTLLISEDCGATFTPTSFSKGGIPLATAGMMSTIFSPNLTTQWRNDRIDLTSYKGKKIFVRFRARNMNGNNLFIDNINLMLKNAWPLGLSDPGSNGFSVYPNPSDGNYTLEFNTSESKDITYHITNLAGQRIRQSKLSLTSGTTKTALNLSNMASGVYILELRDGNEVKKMKLIKQ